MNNGLRSLLAWMLRLMFAGVMGTSIYFGAS